MLEGEMQTCYLGYSALADLWMRRYSELPLPRAGSKDELAGHRAFALEMRHSWLDLAAKAKAAFNCEVQDIIAPGLQ